MSRLGAIFQRLNRAPRRDTGEPLTILIVDGFPEIGRLIAQGFAQQGLRTLTAVDGNEAQIAILRHGATNIDLLICETSLPSVSGVELAAWFLRNNPHGRAVMMSASRFSEDLGRRAVFLSKPFRHEELVEKMIDLLTDTGFPLECLQRT